VEWAKDLVSGSVAVTGCEKNWLEREREVAEICLSDKWKFCLPLSAHMLSIWMVAAIYRRTHSPSRLAWSEGWRPPGAQSAFIKSTG